MSDLNAMYVLLKLLPADVLYATAEYKILNSKNFSTPENIYVQYVLTVALRIHI